MVESSPSYLRPIKMRDKLTISVVINGVGVNHRYQCAHYHSDTDVVAIKFKCCGTFYACIYCHEEMAGHEPELWGKDERQTYALACGNCRRTFSIEDYLRCEDNCPKCGTTLNPGCVSHYRFYFEL